jgi:hypothetical protein
MEAGLIPPTNMRSVSNQPVWLMASHDRTDWFRLPGVPSVYITYTLWRKMQFPVLLVIKITLKNLNIANF